MSMGSRVLSGLLALSFLFFAGNSARADLIFSGGGRLESVGAQGAAGASSGVGANGVTEDGTQAASVATSAHLAANPAQVHDAGAVEIVALGVLAIVAFAVYFFGATAHPTPGW